MKNVVAPVLCVALVMSVGMAVVADQTASTHEVQSWEEGRGIFDSAHKARP